MLQGRAQHRVGSPNEYNNSSKWNQTYNHCIYKIQHFTTFNKLNCTSIKKMYGTYEYINQESYLYINI